MNRLSALLAAALFCVAASPAWAQPHAVAQRSTPVENANYGRDFKLHDPDGSVKRLADFRGAVLVLFFGYTSCPDACPTALLKLHEALALLPEAARAKVQVRFVTLDPERDSPAVLKDYLGMFGEQFHALTGTPAEIAEAKKEFRVYARRSTLPGTDFYVIDHSTNLFLFDPQGKLRLVAPHAISAENLAKDLQSLLDAPRKAGE
ncbi:MAG: SCO family protein [Rhodocyclaceae bacterium]|nr:SCO family protein [Rhodocyclaceae bacterium]